MRAILDWTMLLASIFAPQLLHVQRKAPAEASRVANPLSGSDAAAGGRKLFLRHCAECHGETGIGKRKNATNLTATSVRDQSDGELFWKITNGKSDGDMPSFSRLPEPQRWQLVLYIRELSVTSKTAAGGP